MRDYRDRLDGDNYLGSVDGVARRVSPGIVGLVQTRLYIFIDALLRKGRLP